MEQRYITAWRRTDDILKWDHHVSENKRDLEEVIKNITKQGVHQYITFELGDKVLEFSSTY